ncbi:MAG: hypothetical protein R3D67_16750 [Hyphomicrobiaceae bacterium]
MLDGIPYEDGDGRDMEDIVFDAVEGCLKGIPPARRRDANTVREAVRRSVRSAIDQAWGKRPIVKVFVAEVNASKGS